MITSAMIGLLALGCLTVGYVLGRFDMYCKLYAQRDFWQSKPVNPRDLVR